MKVKWKGETEVLVLTKDIIYDVVSVEKGWYRIVDDSGEDYLYPPQKFEIVEMNISKKADFLVKEIWGKHTDEEWLKLEEDVAEFLKNEATVDDRVKLRQYTEKLLMVCNGIRYMQENKEE